jgi:signal transduction histidine kinase
MQLLFQKMLLRIEKDYQNLKEYTENMAHEVQTPLTIIRNKTENLIADDQLMQKHASDVKIIYDESNHLSSLGSTLNLLTKIENGEFSATDQISTKPVIEKHVDAIHESAQLKSMYIEMNLADEHIVRIDPFLLDIILKNLLRNAIRYGSNDGPIRICTTQNEMLISNYGTALDVPVQKLFERFYRNDKTSPSLGLGLALVRKICDLNAMCINYRYENGQHFFSIVHDSN